MAVPYSRYVVGTLPWYSVLIVLGAALAIWLAIREEKRAGLPKDTILDLALCALPIGFLGARLYYVLFSWYAYRDNPIAILYVWEGGLAIYGGLIAGGLTVLVFCRRRQLSLRTVLDVLAPGVVLAQAIGRWGNYFNQEAYGLAITDPALQFFPIAVLIQDSGVPVWHMATFFYESVLNFLNFLFLLRGRRHLFRRRGDVFFAYAFLYAATRLIVENFRMDSLYLGGNTVRVSQLLSVVICGAVLGACVLRVHREQGRLRPAGAVLSLLAVPLLIALVVFCLRPELFPFRTAVSQLLFLSLSSVCLAVTLLAVYRNITGEVCYADHQA